jgi:hypothetical protein
VLVHLLESVPFTAAFSRYGLDSFDLTNDFGLVHNAGPSKYTRRHGSEDFAGPAWNLAEQLRY